MKRYILRLFIVFLLITNVVFADLYTAPVALKDILKNMPELNSIECKFRQEKIFNNISKPIVSSGDFKFIKNSGVYFYTKYPIKSTADYTNKSYKQINDVIKAISTKKYSKLENEFNFYYEGNISKWILGLKPKKNSSSYNILSSITVYGSDYIEKISIIQVNGNKTIIWFIK